MAPKGQRVDPMWSMTVATLPLPKNVPKVTLAEVASHSPQPPATLSQHAHYLHHFPIFRGHFGSFFLTGRQGLGDAFSCHCLLTATGGLAVR